MTTRRTLPVLAALVAAFLISGCDDGEPRGVDPRYQACLDAGGDYQWHGTDGSYSCTTSKEGR